MEECTDSVDGSLDGSLLCHVDTFSYDCNICFKLLHMSINKLANLNKVS